MTAPVETDLVGTAPKRRLLAAKRRRAWGRIASERRWAARYSSQGPKGGGAMDAYPDILLVDDDADLRACLRVVLELEGCPGVGSCGAAAARHVGAPVGFA